MPEIPDIGIADIRIPQTYKEFQHPAALPNIHPPVTVNLGFPVVEIPGCVEAHQDNNREGKPWDKDLVEDDPNQVMVLCPHGSYPSYDSMNFEPDRVLDTIVAKRGQAPPPGAVPDTSKAVPPDEDVECPGPNSPRIGDVAQNKTEKVSGFELSKDGKICIVLYEDIGVVEQYLPAPQVVATTGGIAVVATTSALLAKPLADLLLKVVKPLVKKTIGKIQKMLGKTPYRPTASEIQTNQYREKKGMLPLKFGQKKKPLKKVEEKKG